MNTDISRRAAVLLCNRLSDAIPDFPFLPEMGTDPNSFSEPPFAVPVITEANDVYPGGEVYKVMVDLKLITSSNDTPADTHSDIMRQIMAVLLQIKAAAPFIDSDLNFYVNGLVVFRVSPLPDDQGHGNVIKLMLACQFPMIIA